MKRLLSAILTLTLFWATIPAFSEDTGIWKQGQYVDEFKEATGEQFSFIDLEGVFDNTATSNSELSVKIIVDFNNVEFYLLEYGTYKLTNLFSSPTYTINVKDNNGNVHTFSGSFDEATSRIILDVSYRAEMLDVLNAGGKISFSITDDNSSSTHYAFTISNSQNFNTQWRMSSGLTTAYMSSFAGGLVPVVSNGKMGAINVAGEIVIPCEYDIVYDCSDGMMRIYNGDFLELDGGSRMWYGGVGKFGYISNDGKNVIAMEYEGAGDFAYSRAFVRKNGKWGCIDTNGDLVIPCQYDDVYLNSFFDDRALVFIGTLNTNGYPADGKYAYIDLDGNTIYEGIDSGYSFSEGLARVVLDGKTGYIDVTGQLVIEAKWDEGGDFSIGTTWVTSNGQTYLIDQEGNQIAKINENSIKYVGSFSDGMAYVTNTDYRRGFINQSGSLVIPCIFKNVGDFEDGYTFVENEDSLYGIIDRTGEFTVPCQWDEISRAGSYYCVRKFATRNSQTGLGVGGTYGLIDAYGSVILDCVYSSINYGEGYYTISKDAQWMIFNEEMNQVY